QRRQAFRSFHRSRPRDVGAPVVADHMYTWRSTGINQRPHILDQRLEAVIAPTRRTRTARVTPLIGSQTAIPLSSQPRGNQIPAGIALGKPVQQHHHRPITRAFVDDIEDKFAAAELFHTVRIPQYQAGRVLFVSNHRPRGKTPLDPIAAPNRHSASEFVRVWGLRSYGDARPPRWDSQ